MFRASASPASPPAFCLVLLQAENERTLLPRVDPRLGRFQHAKAQRLYIPEPACWPDVSSRPAPGLFPLLGFVSRFGPESIF